jgi:hypothetical protein
MLDPAFVKCFSGFCFSFDSGKFSRQDKVRLREAIDNLNTANLDSDENSSTKLSHSKRLKTTNVVQASTEMTTSTNGGNGIFSCGCSSSGEVLVRAIQWGPD